MPLWSRALLLLCVCLLVLAHVPCRTALFPATACCDVSWAVPGGATRADAAMVNGNEAAAELTEASLDRHLRRWKTRTERLGGRVATALWSIVVVFAWLVLSSLTFLAVAAVAGAMERALVSRLFRDGAAAVRSLWLGVRVFLGAASDGAAPLAPRLLLAAGWLYWLSPVDVLAEEGSLLSYLDDAVIAIGAAKVFLVLCPAWILERQARKYV